jgi:CheY-like chemotaxis protein
MDNRLAFVVEDEASVAELFAESLRRLGFEVEVLRTGKAAQQRLEQAVPAVVTLDLNLPYVSGAALLDQIRADPRLEQTRVIVTTGDPQRAAALKTQADLVLVKPVSFNQLSALAARLSAGTGPLSVDVDTGPLGS